jgi:hypothetical protein
MSATDAGDALSDLGSRRGAPDADHVVVNEPMHQSRPESSVPEPERATMQYAGSGLVVNQYGMNPSDAAANARELGWFLVRATKETTVETAQLRAQAHQIYVDLGDLADGGETVVSASLVDVYNALLEQAKERLPDDGVLATLTPIAEAINPRVLRALAGQLVIVLGNA